MGFLIPAIISGVGALAGALSNRPKTTTQTMNQTTNQSQNQTGVTNVDNSSMPIYDPQQLAMRNFLLQQYYNRLDPARIEGLTQSTIGAGVNAANNSYAGAEQALRASLAGRGLSYSPVAGAGEAQLQQGRVGSIIGTRAQAPLIKNQLESGALSDFGSFLSTLPTGTHNFGTTSSASSGNATSNTQGTGTNTDPGNMLGGAVGGLGSMLAFLYGQGAFGGTKGGVTSSGVVPGMSGNR